MERRAKIAEWAAFAVLWAAYFAYGLWWRRHMPAEGGFLGFDHNALGTLLSRCAYIPYFRVRHPLFGWLLSPVTLLGEPAARASYAAYWGYLSAVFAAVVTGCVWLVWRIGRAMLVPVERTPAAAGIKAALCAAGFACFGYMRVLAAGPESYSISMLLALALVAWMLKGRRDGCGGRLDAAVWGVLSAAMAGITVTQGAKAALAYLATHRLSKKRLAVLILAASAAGACAGALYMARLDRLGAVREGAGGAFAAAWAAVAQCIRSGLTWQQRLRMLEMFFFEPIVPHGAAWTDCELTAGYASPWPYALCAALYALAFVGAWRARRTALVRMLAAMFSVDAAIHLVFFWGMGEAQIYCGHWFYALPLLWACAIARGRCGIIDPFRKEVS